jgi:hypothetical protein
MIFCVAHRPGVLYQERSGVFSFLGYMPGVMISKITIPGLVIFTTPRAGGVVVFPIARPPCQGGPFFQGDRPQ